MTEHTDTNEHYDYCASYVDGSRKPGSCGDECQCSTYDKGFAEASVNADLLDALAERDRFKRQADEIHAGLAELVVELNAITVERDRYRAALERIAGNGHVLGWSVAADWAQDAMNGGTDD